VHTTDATFAQDVLKADKPVLLDFWARMVWSVQDDRPDLDEIASEYQDRIKIAKLNIDENPQTPPKFGIRGIPPDPVQERHGRGTESRRRVQVAALGFPGQQPVRGYLGNQGRNRPNKGPRHGGGGGGGGGSRDGNRDGNRGNNGGRR